MKNLITILSFFFLANFAFSQNNNPPDTTSQEEYIKSFAPIENSDSTNIEDDFDLSQIQYGDIDNEYSRSESAPTLELSYVMSTPRFHSDEFSSKFAKTSGFELRLGSLDKDPVAENPNIFEFDYTYGLFSLISSEFSSGNKVSDLKSSSWKFGIGSADGYGWKLSENSDISLYNSGSIDWTSTNFKDTTLIAQDNQKMKDFGTNLRFGTTGESGIQIGIYKPVAINVSYEKSIVFPRTMFWFWAASEITEAIGTQLVDMFLKKVIHKSSTFAPVVNWVLKSGVSYGMNYLREKNMNWPVETVAPFVNEKFKASLSFSF